MYLFQNNDITSVNTRYIRTDKEEKKTEVWLIMYKFLYYSTNLKSIQKFNKIKTLHAQRNLKKPQDYSEQERKQIFS